MLFQAFSERFQIPAEDSMKSKKWEKVANRSLLGDDIYAGTGGSVTSLSRNNYRARLQIIVFK